MRISFEREIPLPVGVDEAWTFLSDVDAVVSCLPNVSDLKPKADGAYDAVASDKVGPFRIRMDVTVAVEFDEEHHSVEASLVGNDRKSGTRVSGTLTAGCVATGDRSCSTSIVARAEVLGPVATLGAGPIRRRMDDILAKSVECVTARLTPA